MKFSWGRGSPQYPNLASPQVQLGHVFFLLSQKKKKEDLRSDSLKGRVLFAPHGTALSGGSLWAFGPPGVASILQFVSNHEDGLTAPHSLCRQAASGHLAYTPSTRATCSFPPLGQGSWARACRTIQVLAPGHAVTTCFSHPWPFRLCLARSSSRLFSLQQGKPDFAYSLQESEQCTALEHILLDFWNIYVNNC